MEYWEAVEALQKDIQKRDEASQVIFSVNNVLANSRSEGLGNLDMHKIKEENIAQ